VNRSTFAEEGLQIAIVGWEEGSAGQIHSWASHAGFVVRCFVHPEDTPPQVTFESATRDRDCTQFAFPHGGRFKDCPLICTADWPAQLAEAGVNNVIVTISDNELRLAEIEKALQSGLTLISVKHPTVTILPDAIIGSNVILHARCVIGYRAEIGDGVIVNTGAQVDHHCVLRVGCRLDPGVILSGNVTVGKCATLHSGAVVKHRIRIGERSVVGAGAVVIRDVTSATTVVGVPAKVLGA
jgi:sugar O-acyltransferase (sialic acid O-acetyltransferase NeuD family)